MGDFKQSMTFKEFLEYFPKIKDNYLDFEMDSVSFTPDNIISFTVVGDLRKDKCECYRVSKERHYLTDYEKGYYEAIYHKPAPEYEIKHNGICYGTKDREPCDCGGDKSKCNFKRWVMNKLEGLIKFKIGYYDSMINILSAEDLNENQRNIFILETKKRALEQVLEDYHNEEA